jgi:hypothetical protein
MSNQPDLSSISSPGSSIARGIRPVSSLLVALFLQFAPLVRTIEPAMAGILQPVFMLLRWAAAASAVAGGAHALSGATGLTTANAVRATNGVATSYRAGITSDQHGTAKSYSATALAPGLRVTSLTGGIISGTPTNTGVYRTQVRGWENSNATGDSFTATVTFTVVDQAISITGQPQPATVDAGQPVTFSVTATGTSRVYRWLHDDLEIAGATNSTFTIASVKGTDAGNYQVRVSNGTGSTLSTKALLTVNAAAQPPTFTSITPSFSVHEGDNASISAVATATGAAPTLSWTFNGNPVVGVTGSPLALSKVSPAQGGSYRAVATANGLSTTSAPVVLTVLSPLRILTTSADDTRFALTVGTINGRRYFLETASDPTSASWQPVTSAVATGSTLELADPNRAPEVKTYRVRAE